MKWLKDIFGSKADDIIGTVADTVDRFVTTGEERAEIDRMKEQLKLDFMKMEFEAEKAYIADRQSARDMYAKDSSLQKIFSITFLAGYLILTGVLFWLVLGWANGSETVEALPAWGVSLITAVFTAMSTKVNTIVDFLFGGSESKDNSERIMAETMRQNMGSDN